MPNPNEKNKTLDESMQRAYQKVLAEMPNIQPTTLSPSDSPMNITGWLMPRNAQAVTNPLTGNVTYNPEAMAGLSPQEQEQTLAHELTHVGQVQSLPYWQRMLDIGKRMFTGDEHVPAGIQPNSILDNPYQWRPEEMAAFQAERQRATKMGLDFSDPVLGTRDIQLRRDKPINTGPSSNFNRR